MNLDELEWLTKIEFVQTKVSRIGMQITQKSISYVNIRKIEEQITSKIEMCKHL